MGALVKPGSREADDDDDDDDNNNKMDDDETGIVKLVSLFIFCLFVCC